MKRPTHWPWFLALVALLAVVASRKLHRTEPTYAGRPLSAWLHEEAASSQRYRTPDEVLSGAGGNLVPFLIQQLNSRDSLSGRRFRSLVDRLPGTASGLIPKPPPADQIHAVAASWLGRLGPAAAPAVPALISLLNEPEVASPVARALGRIGPAASAAVPALIRTATATNGSFFAGRALLQIGSYGSNDLTQLIAHRAPEVRLTGEVGARLLAGNTNSALQLLVDTIGSAPMRFDALLLLKDFGPAAGPMTLQLTWLLRATNAPIRHEGANLLASIGPTAAPAAPALIDALSGEQEGQTRRAMIQALGAIGASASNAVPLLTELLHGDDELTIAAARQALGQIRAR